MSDTSDMDVTELDGDKLLADGRRAREQRHHDRSLRTRLSRLAEGKPGWMKIAALSAAGLVAAFLFVVLLDVVVSFGRIHPGVRIGEVGVGAARPHVAASRVEEVFVPRLEDPLTLVFEEEEWIVAAADLGVSLDSEPLVEQAMAVGRTGTLLERASVRARLWFAPETIPVQVSAEASAVAGLLGDIAETIEREPSDAAVVIEGTEARIQPASLGIRLRTDAVRDDVLSAFASVDRVIEAQVSLTPVRITDEGAARALEDTRAMLAGPVTVSYDSDTWEFQAAEVAQWIDFREAPSARSSDTSVAAGTVAATASIDPSGETTDTTSDSAEEYELEAFISPEKSRDAVLDRTGSAGKDPVDAQFKVGGGTVTIIPAEDGLGPDVEALAIEMTRVLTTEDRRVVELKTQLREPEITTEKARAMGIQERIATYTTTFASTNKPRVHNIHTLADALDGTLVPPGGVFSFNDTIGPRTAAKGYQEAAAIIGGKLVPSLGGGICQVGTTIFNTVFESGLPVVERRNHSFYLSAYPDGRDATVSWGGPDFKFKNDTDSWILVATAYSNSSVTVSLYGTDPSYSVKGSTGSFTNIVPFPVEEIKDPELAIGARVVQDSGINGRRIVVKRTVTKGGTVVREDSFTSVYRAKEQVVRVGTKVDGSVVDTATVSP